MKKRKYQICSNCIMDTSDHRIVFNSEGKCDHCINFLDNLSETWQDSIHCKSITKLKLIAKAASLTINEFSPEFELSVLD